MDLRRITGTLGLTAVILLAILFDSSLMGFLDIPSLLMTMLGGMAAWGAMSGRGVATLAQTLRSERASASDLAAGIETVRAGKRSFWMVSIAGTLIGFTQMLQSLDDPSAIGPATAVAFLTIFYALLTNLFVLSPVETRLRERLCMAHAPPLPVSRLDDELAHSRKAMDALKARVRSTTEQTR